MDLSLLPSFGPHRVVQFLHGLIAASILAPLVFLAAYSWGTYTLALTDADELVQRTVDVLHENTLKVFETQELILDQVANLAAGRSAEEITSTPDINSKLKKLEEGRAQVASIWLIDSQGQIRAGSVPWSPELNASDRDYFRAHPNEDAGTYIGRAYVGRATGQASFGFSRRWPTADGSFAGVISISVSSAYFATFFGTVAPEIEHMAMLVRTDGEVLAREPLRPDLSSIPKDDPLMQAISAENAGLLWRVSRLDGIRRLYGYRKIGQYPLAVTFAVSKAAILRPWLNSLAIYAGITVLVGISMVSLSVFALRRVHLEQQALERAVIEARQRSKVEDQLRRSQKLEALGQLTGGVVHDFGNLLFGMLGNLEMLRDQPLDRRSRARVENALEAGERANRLLQSLMAFARQQPLEPTTLDVSSVVEGMQELLRQSLGPEGSLILKPTSDLWRVSADKTQLEMSVLNLVVNARDALSGNGQIVLETRNVKLEGEPEGLNGEFVALSVSDNGHGMSREVLEHAFEPFFTTKGPGKGTGLGLPSVYGFAKQCGGTAVIESEFGSGTNVTIYLPRLRGDADHSARDAARNKVIGA